MVHDNDVPLRCATCGRELQGDRDDDPNGPNGPICGDCARERDDLDDVVLIDLLDGELDGQLG